jgi:hypothetical protein
VIPTGAVTPTEVRPQLAQATAASLDEVQAALLDAAVGATRENWTTFTCPDCGKKHRVQVQVPDVRARVGAIELLLREGLGRPPQAEETPAPRLPTTAAAVTAMSWDELQLLGATLFAEEIAAVAEGGDRLLRQRLASLGADERRVLREALAEPEFA